MIKSNNQGAVKVFEVASELNEETSELLRKEIDQLPRLGRALVVADLTECPLIDSKGCEGLLDALDIVTNRDGVIHLVGLNPLCRDVLTATGVGDRFLEFERIRDAVIDLAK